MWPGKHIFMSLHVGWSPGTITQHFICHTLLVAPLIWPETQFLDVEEESGFVSLSSPSLDDCDVAFEPTAIPWGGAILEAFAQLAFPQHQKWELWLSLPSYCCFVSSAVCVDPSVPSALGFFTSCLLLLRLGTNLPSFLRALLTCFLAH